MPGSADARAKAVMAANGASPEQGSETVAAVDRGADVLLHFALAGRPTLGVTDIANDLHLSKAVVHRLLASLRSRNLITLDAETRRYSLGPMALRLGMAFLEHLDVRRVASPELAELSAFTNETATLSVRSGDMRVYVEQVTPKREVIMSVSLGTPYPLHAGSSSKAFLAFLSPAEIEAYLSRELTKVAPATITNPRKLERELKEIRELGYARSFGERQPGAASIAAPVLAHDGAPAAVISLCGPAERFAAVVDSCVDLLLAATRRASAGLGYVARA